MRWRSPSNLALIKYWGKYKPQKPLNPSISFTLAEAYTDMQLEYQAASSFGLSFSFEGKENPAFAAKIEKLLQTWQTEYFPFLSDYRLVIDSSNSFPHSAGIASSASSMSALALCLCQMERDLGGLQNEAEFKRKASFMARLGSGSACRSVFGPLALWGETPLLPHSSDDYALEVSEGIAPVFKTFCNSILLISKREKSVSSTAGHALMENHPFAQARYAQARENLARLLPALASGDLQTFIEVVEEEALSLHGLMFNSRPSYVLLEPESLAAVQAVRAWRKETGLPLCFSIDAGPNLHLLYPASIAEEVKAFIDSDLRKLCSNGEVLHDVVGPGPSLLEA